MTVAKSESLLLRWCRTLAEVSISCNVACSGFIFLIMLLVIFETCGLAMSQEQCHVSCILRWPRSTRRAVAAAAAGVRNHYPFWI